MKKFFFLLGCAVISAALWNCVPATGEATGGRESMNGAPEDDARTQFERGRMYYWGQGVAPDCQAALEWFRRAAAQGSAEAQYVLGGMYYLGDGVEQDYVRAHMWFTMAAAQGSEKAREIRDVAAAKMTPEQLEEARKLAKEQNARGYAN